MPTVDMAEDLMREGSFLEARKILSEILIDNPENLRAICDIGIAFTETGENEKAIRALKHYIRYKKNNAYAWEALGCAQFRTGQFRLARASLNKSLRLMPGNPSTLRNLGILNGVEGQKEEGLAYLQKSMRLAPGDYRTLYALNFAFRDMNCQEEREKILDRILELEIPDAIRRDIELARIHITIGWE